MKVRRHRQGERFFIAGFFQEMVKIVTRNLLKKTSLWAGEPQNEGKNATGRKKSNSRSKQLLLENTICPEYEFAIYYDSKDFSTEFPA